MRRVLLFSCALLAGCSGLEFDRGNAFPCDFSLPPGERDLACVAGDVCGSDNLCKRYFYEGPRFESVPTVPVYGPGSGEGEVLHPLVLDQPVVQVMSMLPRQNERDVLVLQEDGSLQALDDGVIGTVTPMLPSLGATAPDIARIQVFTPEGLLNAPSAMVQDVNGNLYLDPRPLNRQPLPNATHFKVLNAEPAAIGERPPGARPWIWDGDTLRDARRPLIPVVQASAPILDIAAITLPRRQWLVLLENDAVELAGRRLQEDGGFDPGLDGGGIIDVVLVADLVPVPATSESELRTDPGGRIVAGVRHGKNGLLPDAPALDVLSTFQVNVGRTGPTLTAPWPDCRPCALKQRVLLFTPSVRSGAPVVEVVCGGLGQPTSALRIVGSVALSQFDACVSEQIELPVPFASVATTSAGRPVDWPNQDAILLGGKHGELWSGDTLSQLRPFFLERVPLDVTQTVVLGQPSLAAVTDDYLAVLEPPQVSADMRRNGFRRISNEEIGASGDNKLLGFVHAVNGWGVTMSGALVRLESGVPDGGALVRVTEGPTLVTADGDLIRDSIGGEAYFAPDGGLAAMYLVADDSLYFLPHPEDYLDGGSDWLLTPDLTPEPSVPIRSLALERTPLGTNGDDAARGYLVTSRDVYEWQLGGDPPRWSARPIALSSGEPLEVWFDRPRSALGRVGFTNGEVYTLPGGYQLTEPLPGVRDYENLGGWPVAYSDFGLFIAGWDLVGTKLQNRFSDGGVNRPMAWNRVTLPDGSEPWMANGEAREGRLFVTVDETKKVYRLLVFLDDLVVQVATHTRQ